MRSLDQSPPRTEYTKSDPAFRGKTLIDLQFTPSTVLYIKFLEHDDLNRKRSLSTSNLTCLLELTASNAPVTSTRPPLRAELLDIAAQLPPPPLFEPTEDSQAGKAKPTKMSMGGDKGKVVPSWLKIGGNKFPSRSLRSS